MSGIRVVLFNNTKHPMTQLEHIGTFNVLVCTAECTPTILILISHKPPQAIGALSTAEFEIMGDSLSAENICKYAMENVAGVFEL
jgi:hypothetical protein